METEQLYEKQTENIEKVAFDVLFHNQQAHKFLEEKLRNMEIGDGGLLVFDFKKPYFLRSLDKEINQILDSDEHVDRKYNKEINEQDLTYRIKRME